MRLHYATETVSLLLVLKLGKQVSVKLRHRYMLDQSRDTKITLKKENANKGKKVQVVNTFMSVHKETTNQKRNQSEREAEGRRILQVRAAESCSRLPVWVEFVWQVFRGADPLTGKPQSWRWMDVAGQESSMPLSNQII